MPRILLSKAIIAVTLAVACASSKPPRAEQDNVVSAVAAPPVTPLDAPPAALRTPVAPGLDVLDLSTRLRAVLASSSGLAVIDEVSVRHELAACDEGPCAGAMAEKFSAATLSVTSSVSSLGSVYLSMVRVQRGSEELVRTTAQADNARTALESAGAKAGALLHARLLADGVQEREEDP